MKVLQINSVCGYGSTGRITTDIYKTLEEHGHECIIAYGRGVAPNQIKSIKIGTNFNNYIHVVKTRLFDKHGFSSTKATKKFIKKAREYNADVIHLHNIHGYYISIELLFKYLKDVGKPVIWTLHDCWAFTGHCTHFDYVDCDKWKNGCNCCPQRSEYPSSLIVDNSKSNYEMKKRLFTGINNLTIVTPSRWLSNLVRQSFLKEYNIKVINNGINLNVFEPNLSDFKEKHNIKNKFIILGIASVWNNRKGFGYFIELSNRIKNDEIIVMVGVTDKQKNMLPNNIIGITKTNNTRELAEIYSAADVFINATLEDNFPTTNLEALACGTPVITFNTGGSIESVNNNCGIIVEKGDMNELVDAINKCREEKFNFKDCIKQSRLYGRNDRFNDYIKLYWEVYK